MSSARAASPSRQLDVDPSDAIVDSATSEMGRAEVQSGASWRRARAHLQEPLFRNAYALMLSSAGSGLAGILYWALAAHHYSSAVIGENGALIAAMVTVSTFAQLDIASMLLKFLPLWRARAARAIGLGYLISGAMAILLSAALVLGASRLRGNLRFLGDPGIGIFFGVAVVAWGVFAIQDGVLTGLGRTTIVPIENLLYGAVKLVLLVGVAESLGRWGIFVSWNIPVLLAILPINFLIFKRFLPRHRHRQVAESQQLLDRRTTIKYIVFDYVGGLCGAIMTMAMPLLVLSIVGAGSSGHFYIAWLLVVSCDTITLSLGSSLLVESSYDPARLRELGRRALRRSLTLLLPIAIIIGVLAPEILRVFGKGYSSSAATALRILLLGVVSRTVISSYAAVARVRGEVIRVLGVVLILTALVVMFVVLLGRRYGVNGVAVGWALANGVVGLGVLPRLYVMLRRTPGDGHTIVHTEPVFVVR